MWTAEIHLKDCQRLSSLHAVGTRLDSKSTALLRSRSSWRGGRRGTRKRSGEERGRLAWAYYTGIIVVSSAKACVQRAD